MSKPAYQRATVLLATAWVGSLWTVGYLAAPTLFATLADRTLAGTVAGQLFQAQAWLSVVAALALMVLCRLQREKISWLLPVMLLCTLIGYFALHPFMAELRAQGLANPEVQKRFGALHAVSSAIYLLDSVLGAIYMLRLLARSAFEAP